MAGAPVGRCLRWRRLIQQTSRVGLQRSSTTPCRRTRTGAGMRDRPFEAETVITMRAWATRMLQSSFATGSFRATVRRRPAIRTDHDAATSKRDRSLFGRSRSQQPAFFAQLTEFIHVSLIGPQCAVQNAPFPSSLVRFHSCCSTPHSSCLLPVASQL